MEYNEIELMPCPFCGCDARFTKWNIGAGDDERFSVECTCSSCMATIGTCSSIEQAAEKWNYRYSNAELAAKTRALEAANNLAKDIKADLVELRSDCEGLIAQSTRQRAELERVRGYVNEYGEMYSRTELERRKLDERAEFYQDELAKAQAGADEMAALAWKWKYKADCLRETIRCLVVACRATWKQSLMDSTNMTVEDIVENIKRDIKAKQAGE